MKLSWQRLVSAIASAFRPLPTAGLSPDARAELERWDAEDVAEYRRTHGGDAPPESPHIDENGI
jgi:hypothetical protein